MLTHRDTATSAQCALDLGADDYLYKDDVASELYAIVAQALAATNLAAGAAGPGAPDA